MRQETNTPDNQTPGIIPSALWRLQEVRPLENYRLYMCFLDGSKGCVDLSRLLLSEEAGVFKTLRSLPLFEKVYLAHGAVTWPGNINFAPDTMYDAIKEKGEWVLY